MQAEPLFYAAFLQLQGKLCTVIGGGQVARRKIQKLISAGARVRIISPVVHDDIAAWAAQGLLEWRRQVFSDSGCLDDAWLIYAATDDMAVNQRVRACAESAGQWVNVSDDADACTFIVPSVLQLGAVQVAFSTSGTDPSLAKKLRLLLAADLTDGTRRLQEELLQYMKVGG